MMRCVYIIHKPTNRSIKIILSGILQVLHLLEEVEIVVRHHLNVHSIKTYDQGTDVRTSIIDEAMRMDSISYHWKVISHSVLFMYEEYSIELLRAVISLWVAIRAHAFAKECMDNEVRG